MKKWYFSGLSVLILALGFVLAGCANDTEEPDVWSDVTSFDQMNGTWKGSYSQTQSIQDFLGSDDGDESGLAEMFGDMKVTTSLEIITTINASAKTQSMSMNMTMTFSGGNIEAGWAMLKAFMGSEDGVTVNEANHSITMTESQDAESISDEDISELLNQNVQINQNGTKIKLPAGQMGEDSPELILVKQ
jgi:hypothetical protein